MLISGLYDDDDDVSFYTSTASTWTLATQRTTWESCAVIVIQVLWVDLLTPEEFSKGFGSHTPMFSGQTKCVRYYMNYTRASNLHKSIIISQGFALDGQNQKVPVTGDNVEKLQKVLTPLCVGHRQQ